MYGGLSIVFFLLVLFLQGVAGYSALAAGSASIPVTLVMFVLAGALRPPRRPPRAALVHGRRAARLRRRAAADAAPRRRRGLLDRPAARAAACSRSGSRSSVAPLTATVLADADENNAGIASAVNNAIARVAGLVAIAAIGAMVAAQYDARFDDALGAAARARPWPRDRRHDARPAVRRRGAAGRWTRRRRRRCVRAQEEASVDSFHFGVGIAAVLVALGGVLGLVGIRNPRREVAAEGCRGRPVRRRAGGGLAPVAVRLAPRSAGRDGAGARARDLARRRCAAPPG